MQNIFYSWDSLYSHLLYISHGPFSCVIGSCQHMGLLNPEVSRPNSFGNVVLTSGVLNCNEIFLQRPVPAPGYLTLFAAEGSF